MGPLVYQWMSKRSPWYPPMLLIFLGIAVAVLPGHRGWFDIGVYHGAVNYWVHEGGQIYNYVRPESTYGFTYPPFAALVMLPMAAVAWHPTIALNGALTLAAGLFLVWTLAGPVVRRMGLPRAYGMGMAVVFFGALGPVRDTILFGQINLLLMALVYLDLVLLTRGSRFAGIGIGLAAAIKLTPGIFLIYLLLTRRWRAAIVSAATALGATGLAAIAAPDATRTYFTELMWDTSRIGNLAYVSNQSLMGLVSRHFGGVRAIWVCLAVAVLIIWGYKARRANLQAGFAMTGVVACLVSPITWVHHLVWLAPGLLLLVQRKSTRRLAVWCWVLLVSCLVWAWSLNSSGLLGFLGSNAYVYVSLAMLWGLAGIPVPAPVKTFAFGAYARMVAAGAQAHMVVAGERAYAIAGGAPVRVWDGPRATSRLPQPIGQMANSSPNDPASQWLPTIQVLASAHARHLR